MAVSKDTEKGTWTSQIWVEDWQGKKKHKKKRGFASKKEALEWESNTLLASKTDMNMKLADFVEVYFRDKDGQLKQRTIRNKRYMIEHHIIPLFGNKAMDGITPADIIQWQNEIRSKGFKETYQRMLQNQMTALFTHATKIYNLKDKEHCHNHIIFCAVDNVEHKKYNDCKRTYRHIRNLSDELCREHGLSVIIPLEQKGKTHYEWQTTKAGTSWKAQMKSDMDNAIHEAHSYEDFISRMQTKGYEVKGETFGDNALKYLSFCVSGQSRFTRVSEKNFGVGYTKESIRERIEKRVKAQEKFPVKKKFSFPKRPDAKRTLIDTDKEKFQKNGALKHWADIQNLKIVAASYAEGGSVEELKQKISERNVTAKEARSAVVDLEHEMKAKAEILKYAKQYMANRKYQRGYEKAKDQDAYFRSHETQIILFGGAENMLKRYGIKTTSLDVEKMQAEYDTMAAQKAKLKKTYQVAEKEAVEADKQLRNIRQYLGLERDTQEKEKTNKKHDISL